MGQVQCPCVGVWSYGSCCGKAVLDNSDGHHIIPYDTERIPNKGFVPYLRVLTLQLMFFYAMYVISSLCGRAMVAVSPICLVLFTHRREHSTHAHTIRF